MAKARRSWRRSAARWRWWWDKLRPVVHPRLGQQPGALNLPDLDLGWLEELGSWLPVTVVLPRRQQQRLGALVPAELRPWLLTGAVLPAMAPVGVIPLLGGVDALCRHLSLC